jgi:hypothetical protein
MYTKHNLSNEYDTKQIKKGLEIKRGYVQELRKGERKEPGVTMETPASLEVSV